MANNKSNNALFLVSVFDAARVQGEATTKVISLLKSGKIKWSDKDLVGTITNEFKLGRTAGSLDVTRDEANVIAGKKPFKIGKLGDDVRTEREHKAWRAAISAWSYVALQAGMPSAQTGKVRAPQMAGARDTTPNGDDANEDGDDKIVQGVPRARTTQDVAIFALRVADVIVKFQNQNADVKFDAYREAFRAYVEAIRNITQ